MAENQVPAQNVQTVVVPNDAPAIDKGLVVRSIVYIVILVNAIASHFGFNFHLNGNEDTIYNYVSDALLVLSFVQAYWKNNNISKGARIIDQVAEQIDLFAGQVVAPNAPVAQPAAPVAEAPVAPAQPAQPAQDNKPEPPAVG